MKFKENLVYKIYEMWLHFDLKSFAAAIQATQSEIGQEF